MREGVWVSEAVWTFSNKKLNIFLGWQSSLYVTYFYPYLPYFTHPRPSTLILSWFCICIYVSIQNPKAKKLQIPHWRRNNPSQWRWNISTRLCCILLYLKETKKKTMKEEHKSLGYIKLLYIELLSVSENGTLVMYWFWVKSVTQRHWAEWKGQSWFPIWLGSKQCI